MTPLRAAAAALAAAAFAAGGCASLRDGGTEALRVDAPPVIQRAPGWCAPATLARALAAEGVVADQALLARRGGATPDGGADVSAFCRSLAPWLALRGLLLREAWRTDAANALALARRYDAEAAADGAPPLAPPPDGGTLALETLFAGARPGPLRRAAAPALPRFRRIIRAALREGRPLVWGVVLGVAPEPGPAGAPAARGGHVRLLVGHDGAAGRVLYSDPWGPDCAVKEMDEADACAITMSLHVLAPL